MRCPKCHYLSFEPEPRCKNCGYDLDLPEADLELHIEAADAPLGDLALRDLTPDTDSAPSAALGPMRREREVIKATAPRPVSRSSSGAVALEPPPAPQPVRKPSPMPPPSPALRAFDPPKRTSDVVAAPEPAPVKAAAPVAPVTTELPLFVKGLPAAEPAAAEPVRVAPVAAPAPAPASPAPVAPAFLAAATAATEAEFAEETPLITLPAEPRVPLAVRRPTPEIAAPKPRVAPARKLGPLDRDLLEDLQRIERNERREAAAQSGEPLPVEDGDIAGAGIRVAAAAIDATILGTLSVGVLWVTLRWVDLSIADAGVLPIVPTGLFLLIVALGYLLMFTAAGGQTLGKMAVGVRVVGDGDGDGHRTSLTISQAFYRSALALPSALAVVGFLPALIGDHRALHDRLSHTRVVRA